MLFAVGHSKERRDPREGAVLPQPKKQSKNRLLNPCRCRLSVVSAILSLVFFSACPGFPVLTAAAESAENPAGKLPTLTTARAAHSLTIEEANRAYPVHLRGVITYFDPDYGTGFAAIFVHDATGGIFVRQPSNLAGKLFAGALVDVTGVSGEGGFGPVVVQPQVTIVGRSPLPPNPPRVSLPHLNTGAEDAQWVEVEGTIHGVLEYSHSVTLRLEMPDGPVNVAMIREPNANYSSLVDAKVRLHADAAPTINALGQMIGVHLMAPNLSALQVIEPAPGDPFARPTTPIDRLLHWDQFSASFHRVHLRGIVTLQWPGLALCIRDATRGICMQTDQHTPLDLGGVVDVAGFVGTANNEPVITDAVFKSTGSSQPVAAQPTTADEALIGKRDSELIQIEGQLIGYDLTSSDTTLLLSSGKTLFPAILPKSLAGSEASPWKIGSRLQVTGICSVRIDAQSHVREGIAVTKSFRVLMRSPRDVVILERPSWWTPAHTVLLLTLALAVTLGVLGWVVVLRRRVEQQADLLRESEALFRHLALHDALTGLATRTLLQDRLDVALESAKRRGTGLAVLMVDLDNFKEINDTYGHPAGDEVLRVTASRLLRCVRKEDTVARLGGDEFVVLLPGLADLHAAEGVAAKIVKNLSVPIPIEGREVPASGSVGVCASAADDLNPDALLRNADAALYNAKANGRNQFQVFKPETVPSEPE
jgi:diguanylate cyclase (GGDEF)-like protein